VNEDYFVIKKKVADALKKGKPVLALESTIISHGMPYPDNIDLALELEKIAESCGAVPATICLMDGKIKIGLNRKELLRLATEKDVAKVSRRDISSVLVNGKVGATTVAATMFLAYKAGIKVFATGGIGGVHRSAEETFDISADLIELSRSPVIVVSAGAKAILDLEKTLEYLETISVPVFGYRTDKFPAFYSRATDLEVKRVNRVSEVAGIYETNIALGHNSGLLLANPIPSKSEIPNDIMKSYIDSALNEAEQSGVSGQKVTPFLLKKIVELSKGKALKANIELVKNNVKVGAEIARILSN